MWTQWRLACAVEIASVVVVSGRYDNAEERINGVAAAICIHFSACHFRHAGVDRW
jgi:hypothetical protein